MPASARSHFIVSQQLTPAVINTLINGWIAWAMHADSAAVSLWGEHGYWSDLVATGVLLPGITWMIIRPLLRHQAAAGKAPAIDGVPQPWLSRFLPDGFWSGAAVIGVIGGLVGLVTVLLLQGLGAPAMPGKGYAVFKGLYGGMLPVLLQPAMVFAILRARRASVASG